jgi:hypothetical protein
MGQDEVVALVAWVLRPWDELTNISLNFKTVAVSTATYCYRDLACAGQALRQSDAQLDGWEPLLRTATREGGGVVLLFGVELHLPPEFERRR